MPFVACLHLFFPPPRAPRNEYGVPDCQGLWEDDIITQASVPVEGGLVLRYQDPNNHYTVRVISSGSNRIVRLARVADGSESTIANSSAFTGTGPWTLRVKIAGQTINAWANGIQWLTNASVTGTTFADGGFGFVAGASGTFDNARIGYDRNGDNDIDDTTDELVYNESFGGTSVAPTHDNNGNLTADAWYKYTYDAWNRLVKVTTKDDPEGGNVTIATYAYDATGRRIKKAVTNSGHLDTTELYYYAGQQMIETRNGSEFATRQFVFGTQYVDEPIRMDADNDGDGDCMDTFGSEFYYYHQDAHYNVVALTDSDGAVVQRYLYDSYGRLHVYDAFDTANPDRGDLASGEVLDPLINPSAGITVPNPFTYTGRFHDLETGLYHYRARHYHPSLGRFLERDPRGFQGGFHSSLHYADGLNLYQYVSSSPCIGRDSSGLSDEFPPDGPSPPPRKSDGECCDEAKRRGFDDGSQGDVVCCEGRLVACAFSDNFKDIVPGASEPTSERIIIDCVTQHEREHFDANRCPPNSCLYGVFRRVTIPEVRDDPSALAREECGAYTIELHCLQRQLRECASAQNRARCEERLRTWIEDTLEQIQGYCRRTARRRR